METQQETTCLFYSKFAFLTILDLTLLFVLNGEIIFTYNFFLSLIFLSVRLALQTTLHPKFFCKLGTHPIVIGGLWVSLCMKCLSDIHLSVQKTPRSAFANSCNKFLLKKVNHCT